MCATMIRCHRYAVFNETDAQSINIPPPDGVAKEILCEFSAALRLCAISFAFVFTRGLPFGHIASAK